MPGNITFASDRSSINSEFYNTLNSVALVIKEFKNTNVHVEGHTDSTGSDTHNNQLSLDRAQTVTKYLASQDVPYSRLRSTGYGEDRPIASNDSSAGRTINRRVEIQLMPI